MPKLSPDTKAIIWRILYNELVRSKDKMDAFEGVAGSEARMHVDQEMADFLTWLRKTAGDDSSVE